MNINYKKGLLLFLFLLSGILAVFTLGADSPTVDYFMFVFSSSSILGALIASSAYVFLITKFNTRNKKIGLIVFVYLTSVIATYIIVPILLLNLIKLGVVKIKETEGLFEIAFMFIGLIGVPIFMLIFSIAPFLLTIRGRHKRIFKYGLLLATTVFFLIFVFNIASATTCGFGKNKKCVENKTVEEDRKENQKIYEKEIEIAKKIRREGENFYGLIKYDGKIYDRIEGSSNPIKLIENIDLDIETFEQIEDSYYFKDKNNIYYDNLSKRGGGEIVIVEGVDLETFIPLGGNIYAKDREKIYCEGKKLHYVIGGITYYSDYSSFNVTGTTYDATGETTAEDINNKYVNCAYHKK